MSLAVVKRIAGAGWRAPVRGGGPAADEGCFVPRLCPGFGRKYRNCHRPAVEAQHPDTVEDRQTKEGPPPPPPGRRHRQKTLVVSPGSGYIAGERREDFFSGEAT
ncbi:hypothetical protein COCNU_02G005870 [Cocos nucifera]|uniref:Uncharacterized protein n=1 Tax=Cocos nucifera TaxID=13894 RepID=A0A8K0MWY2_COCNU|nr:hypothetical protein COCNU_02G005870 [Cocos nucifera]